MSTASGWPSPHVMEHLRPGGSAQMTWTSGDQADMRIEPVEEPRVFGFTWHIYGLPADDPRRTYVEFTRQFLAALARDWDGRLDALTDHLSR